jgi:NADH:ubiquinone oxidoreductase subunit K
MRPTRTDLAKVATAAAATAAALVAVGSYGNDHQWSAVPFLIGLAVMISAVVFGLLVPRALHAIETGAPAARRWTIGHGIATLLSLVAFWTGAEVIIGSAAILLAVTGRRQAKGNDRVYRLTIWLAGTAMALSVVWTVLNAAAGGN